MAGERKCCICNVDLQQVGMGERFEIPSVRVGTVGATPTHGHGRGVEVGVFRCPNCRRIELYETGGGPEVSVRFG